MKISDFEDMKPGTKILVDGKIFDFGYVGQTGKVILYEEGECNMQDPIANMQDSIAVDPSQCSPTPELAEELDDEVEVAVMNPFERLAVILLESKDPIIHETRHNDVTGEYEVELREMNGRWVKGVAQDLAEATRWAVKAWDDYNRFAHARSIMAHELSVDEGLYQGYQANVAILLYDNFCGADFGDRDTRNEAAKQILHLVFES